jgi:hypothetical protein
VRLVLVVAYIVMAVWLLVAAGLRIALLLAAGLAMDPLPFISGGIGLLALIVLAPAYEERRQRDPRHDRVER